MMLPSGATMHCCTVGGCGYGQAGMMLGVEYLSQEAQPQVLLLLSAHWSNI